MKRILLLIIVILISFQGFSQWNQTDGPQGGHILSLLIKGNRVFAGTPAALWQSADSGSTWKKSGDGLPIASFTAISASGSLVWAGTGGSGIFRSADGGISFTSCNSGLANHGIKALLATPDALYAGSGGGLFYSTDSGDHWTMKGGVIAGKNITSLAVSGSLLIAGSYGNGVFISGDNGSTWQQSNTGLSDFTVLSLANGSGIIVAGTEGGNIFHSADNGNSWQLSSPGLQSSAAVNSLMISGSSIFAGTRGTGVYRSADNGQTWTAINTLLENPFINSLALCGSRLLAGTDGGGIYLAPAPGSSWLPANEGLNASTVNVLFQKSSQLMAGTSGAGFFISFDNGHSWLPRNNGVSSRYITSIAAIGNTLFAGTSGAGLCMSSNTGISWVPGGSGITSSYISALCISGSGIFAGTPGSGVFLSLDSGLTWKAASNGITDPIITSLTYWNNRIYAGTQGAGVFFSSDNGSTWTSENSGLSGPGIKTLAGKGQTLFACTSGGLCRLPATGSNWVPLLQGGEMIHARSVTFFGNTLLIGTDQHGILLSTDEGDNWKSLNTGLGDSTINTLVTTSMNIYAGTGESGTWERPMSNLFTNKVIPDTTILKQTLGARDTLLIQSDIDWSIEGNIPDWFSISKLAGTGNDTLFVTSLKPNLGYLARNFTLYLFSSIAPTISFTVTQLGKNAAVDEAREHVGVTIDFNARKGIMTISARQEISSIAVYSMTGFVVMNRAVNAGNVELNLTSLAKGIYLIKICGAGWTVTRKFEP